MEGISPPYAWERRHPCLRVSRNRRLTEASRQGCLRSQAWDRKIMTRWLGGTISGVFHYQISTDERRLKRRSIYRLDDATGEPWAA